MGRSPCCDKTGLRKGTWTPEEDNKLIAYVTRYGSWNWRQLPKFAGLERCGKSCRLRWLNYLRPDIKRGNFTQQEEDTIIELHQKLGNRWIVIAANLPGRTDNEIKNHWHTNLKKRLIKINKSDTNNGTGNSKDENSNNPTMEEDKKHEGELRNNSGPNITSPSFSIPSSSGTTDTPTDTEISYENYLFDELPLMNVLNDNFWTEPYIIDTYSSDNPTIEEDNTFEGVLENNRGRNIKSPLSSIQSSTSNGPSCITMDSAATKISYENHLLDELPLMDAYMDAWNDNFWTEPYIIDNSYVPPSKEATLLGEGYEQDYYFSPVYDEQLWSQGE